MVTCQRNSVLIRTLAFLCPQILLSVFRSECVGFSNKRHIASIQTFVESFSYHATSRPARTSIRQPCFGKSKFPSAGRKQLTSRNECGTSLHSTAIMSSEKGNGTTVVPEEDISPPFSVSSANFGLNANTEKKPTKDFDFPWSDVQEWALRDNISKFTVVIPPAISGEAVKKCVMWRALAREVPELAGYPISFLQEMHRVSLPSLESMKPPQTEDSFGILPMIDDFEFTSNGGVAGRAYGLPGIADGTRVETPPLISVDKTVPLGYVTAGKADTYGGEVVNEVGFSYELGKCASSSSYSLDGTDRSAALLSAQRLILEGTADSSKRLVDVAKGMSVTGSALLSDQDANRDLLYLGGATAMLLASATAVGMLSHHLTVNVFWV